ncbi:helix-turn-helix domain-containing protein [Nocardia sp. NPDC049149]|uniref:helix-turn-helix domain-containing protein n=1 Tax=Nocardia sp. NPDC049149 TaxID=3364315 RepID=UPI0037115716
MMFLEERHPLKVSRRARPAFATHSHGPRTQRSRPGDPGRLHGGHMSVDAHRSYNEAMRPAGIGRSVGDMSVDHGERLKNARKRVGLKQHELATASGVSLSQITKIEQGDYTPRLETLRALAIAMRMNTSDLQIGNDAEQADPDTSDLWAPVRRALLGQDVPDDVPEEPATSDGVRTAFDEMRPLIDQHRYREISAMLPALLRDADTLEGQQGRSVRARVLTTTGWMLTQNRQFEAAATTLNRAIDASVDRGSAVAAVNVLVWAHLRQGQLTEARDLAVKWADDIEPRFSRATAAQLALWGRLWLYVANAAVRDNSPGETADALSLAKAAGDRIGHEMLYDPNPNRTFGPVTVAQITGECHVIADDPARALAIAEAAPKLVFAPSAAGRLRHRLDVAHAHAQLRQYPEAMGTLQELRDFAPEWLVQQRYARDILGKIIAKRRTLTAEMRELADQIRLEY